MMGIRTLSSSVLVINFLICTSCSGGQWRATQSRQQKALTSSSTSSFSSGDGGGQTPTTEPGVLEKTKDFLTGFFGKPAAAATSYQNNKSNVHANNLSAQITPAVCELINKPEKLSQASSGNLLLMTEWRTYMLTNKIDAVTCLKSCPQNSSAMKDFCHSLNWCRDNCTTSKIIRNCSTNTLAARDTLCVSNNCSPTPPPNEYYDETKLMPTKASAEASLNITGAPGNIAKDVYTVAQRTSDLKVSNEDLEVRKKIFLEMTRKIMNEYEEKNYIVLFADETSIPDDQIARYSELAKLYQERFSAVKSYLTQKPTAKSNYLQHMPETMICINLPTNAGGENHYLEAMEQNNGCGNAFGLGQVISMTFYSNFGLNLTNYGYSTEKLDKKCRQAPIQYLPTECDANIFQSQFFRVELFEKYLGYSIDEIFERRAFDIELQTRLMFATILNSFAMTQNWFGAFRSYRGNGTDYYAQFTPKNHACMNKHMSAEYLTETAVQKAQ